MASTWTHPKLGEFKFSKQDSAWIGTVDAPAFAIFTWELKTPRTQFDLEFYVEDASQEPSVEGVEIALSILAAQKELASNIPKALWDDFKGNQPGSGMWWHDDLEEVAANFGYDDRPAPKAPNDLLPVMRLGGIIIHEEMGEDEKPVAELCFGAVFEEEHGIGVLTDGKSILGLGYSGDAVPFGSLDDEDEDD